MAKEKANVSGSRASRRSAPGPAKSKAVHPGSRRATQMMKVAHRQEKIKRKQAEKKSVIASKVTKLMWFRENIDESKKLYSYAEMSVLIERYLQRFDEELDQIVQLQAGKSSMAGSHRLRYASREDSLRQIVHGETQLFQTSGFEAPDLTNTKLFGNFLSWHGEQNLLPTITLRKYVSSSTSL